jgi:hypothetical protein
MVACNLLPDGADIPLEDVSPDLVLSFTSGAALFATLDFVGAPNGSLTRNLTLISKSEMSTVSLIGYFGQAPDTTPTVVFTANISTISLFDAVRFDNIQLTYLPAKGVYPNFTLSGTCTVQFSADSSWSILGTLTLYESKASFSFTLKSGSLTLNETLGLKISKIDFTGSYTFTPSVTSTLSLSANIDLGPVTGLSSVIFVSGKPAVLVIRVPGTLSISDLARKVFGDDIPTDVINISFSNLLLYYAWINYTDPGDGGQSYTVGFNAQADTDVYGMFSTTIHCRSVSLQPCNRARYQLYAASAYIQRRAKWQRNQHHWNQENSGIGYRN